MSTAIGGAAEDAAAKFLQKQGHKILERNWRTRWCEIDIVSQKSGVVYFVEVKYRRNTYHGDGLDYVTPMKLKQMIFAAEFWLVSHPGVDQDYRLSAISVGGQPPAVEQWLDDLS